MNPTRSRTPARSAWAAALVLACAQLSGCGGGGSAPAEASATDTSMQTASAPATLPGNFRALSAMPETVINAAAAQLPASSGPTYLKVWVTSPETGEVDMLALVRWAPPQVLPAVQPPATATTVQFEIYNDAGSVTGQWSVQ